jgi:hypothetical protein
LLLNGFHDAPTTWSNIVISFEKRDFVISVQKGSVFKHKFFLPFLHSSIHPGESLTHRFAEQPIAAPRRRTNPFVWQKL